MMFLTQESYIWQIFIRIAVDLRHYNSVVREIDIQDVRQIFHNSINLEEQYGLVRFANLIHSRNHPLSLIIK